MNQSSDRYDVRVDWPTVVPMGDTLAVSTDDGYDDRWAEAFEVVRNEHERQASDRRWSRIDFRYTSDEDEGFVLLVREIEPGVQPFELRQTIDDLVQAANTVARVGTHVYELARELRQSAEPEGARGSVPPPSFDPIADELDADAA